MVEVAPNVMDDDELISNCSVTVTIFSNNIFPFVLVKLMDCTVICVVPDEAI
jgi:hypothetical protein